MIKYYKGAYGINLLSRFHGSAAYRGFIPGLLSVGVFLLIRFYGRDHVAEENELGHPYAVGVLVGSVSFLIVFRANNSYNRYWEACSAVHHMMSKFLDATTHVCAYHMQCDHYDRIKPPSYYDHPKLNSHFLTRDRESGEENSVNGDDSRRPVTKSINYVTNKTSHNAFSVDDDLKHFTEGDPTPLTGPRRLDGGWAHLFEDGRSTYRQSEWNADGKGFASSAGGRTPSLFLQELAHLSSLMCAVAFSTLRNDVEDAESPLAYYVPGSPWPDANPIKDCPEEKRRLNSKWLSNLRYMTGFDRTPEFRTKFNAERPMAVLGGVSDNEIKFIQLARGPYAKTQLCWVWLSEFVIREHLAGSTGKVGPPIISRVIQFLSDGMIYYNHARKIMQIPFPFPSAQLAVFYIIVMVFAVPFLMDQYTNEEYLGCLLTFFTVACLSGLHEVARELENPFRNVPNDLPLRLFLAQYNEALITMFAGYHPDAFWDPTKYKARARARHHPENVANPVSEEIIGEAKEEELSQLHALLEKQGREIDRLRKLVEGSGNEEGKKCS